MGEAAEVRTAPDSAGSSALPKSEWIKDEERNEGTQDEGAVWTLQDTDRVQRTNLAPETVSQVYGDETAVNERRHISVYVIRMKLLV